jgi:hypothetical protein
MQIFDLKAGNSLQRPTQAELQSPLMSFFTFKYQQSNQTGQALHQTYQRQLLLQTDEEEKENGQDFAVEYWTLPVKKNQVLARFTNLADKFDSKDSKTRFIDVHSFAQKLLQDANKGKPTGISSVKIEEVSLSGNMPETEVVAHHQQFRWRGDGDDKMLAQLAYKPTADKEESIALEPQQIRQFRITYIPNTAKLTQSPRSAPIVANQRSKNRTQRIKL